MIRDNLVYKGISEISYTKEKINLGNSFSLLFYVMWEKEKISEIYRNNTTGEYKVINFIEETYKLPFAGGPINRDRIYDFFKSRCIDEARPDMKERLAEIGLDIYNPYEIVRRVHGVMWEDHLWVLFPDQDVKWEDIKLRD